MLASTPLPEPIYRVARSPVWGWPDWAYAGIDGTFNNRYDDPDSLYRVLYASESAYGCYLEVLAHFRPDLALYAELETIDGQDENTVEPGLVPWMWRRERRIGFASANGTYADVLAADSIAHLRRVLAPQIVNLQLADLDASTLQMTAPRALTQQVSRTAFNEGFDGVYYHSKYGSDIDNYAIFEGRVFFRNEAEETIEADDDELIRALRTHGLLLENNADAIPHTVRGVMRPGRS